MENDNAQFFYKKIKCIPYLILITFVVSFGLIVLVRLNYKAFPIIDVSAMDTDASTVMFCVDNAKNDNGYLFVNGWAVKEDEELQLVNCSVALRSVNTGESRCMKTAMQHRDDLPGALQIKGSEKAGFLAYVDMDKLSVEDKYEILLIYKNNNNDILVNTNIRINSSGEIIYE